MKNLILSLLCFFILSCGDKTNEKHCTINFEIPKETINYHGIITNIKAHKNILKVSVFNFRNDTINIAVPHLFFTKEYVKTNVQQSDIIVKQFIPSIITDKVITYYFTKDNAKKIISIDSSKTRDMKQQEFKLAPKEKIVKEYILNCNKSDEEKYRIFFFNSNRFNNIKYEKIKYSENAYITIINIK